MESEFNGSPLLNCNYNVIRNARADENYTVIKNARNSTHASYLMVNELHLHKAAGENGCAAKRKYTVKCFLGYRDGHANVTYIFEPGELVHLRVCPHYTLEVHVVAFFDVIRIQRFAHPQANHRLVLYVESPFVLQRAV